MSAQIKSRERVAAHGEVFTNEREVNAMLDMVKQETERIDSRFLEPACGNGNFIAEVLRRKLDVAISRYRKTPDELLRYTFLAVSSIYGVDILRDNVEECRARLFDIVSEKITKALKRQLPDDFAEAIRYVLSKNILCGDALTLKDSNGSPITFAEWSIVTGNFVKRRDFLLSELLEGNVSKGETLPLFSEQNDAVQWEFDEETQTYIPSAIREYPPLSYWEVQRNG